MEKETENIRKKFKRQCLGVLQWKNSSLRYMSTQTVTPTVGTDFWKSPRQVVEQSMAKAKFSSF